MEDLTIEQILTIFYNFLKAKGAFEKYNDRISWFSTPKEKLYKEDIFSWHYLISHAFSWKDTPEGYTYWLRLSLEWNRVGSTYKQYLLESNTPVNIF